MLLHPKFLDSGKLFGDSLVGRTTTKVCEYTEHMHVFRPQKLQICVEARHATYRFRGSGNYLISGGGSTFLLQGIQDVLVFLSCKIMSCFARLSLDAFVRSSGEKSSDDLHIAIV